jgi:two-component system, OmpR family, sensor histidine kinase ChvG
MTSNYSKAWLGLRSKLVLFSSFLLVLPWLGYQYILEMEQYLNRAQEQVVLSTAQALAIALGERTELFHSSLNAANSGSSLYVYPVAHKLSVTDDTLADWREYQQYEQRYAEGSSSPNPANELTSFRTEGTEGDPLAFMLLLGESTNSIFMYVRVQDTFPVFRGRNQREVHRSDALHLAFTNQTGGLERIVLAPYGDGSLELTNVGRDITDVSAFLPEQRIRARFLTTAAGYEYELQIPAEMLKGKLGLAVHDVDDQRTRAVAAIVATSGITRPDELNVLLRPSAELGRIVSAVGQPSSRIRVMDRDKKVLYSSGNIETANGITVVKQRTQTNGAWRWFQVRLLHPVYDKIIRQLTGDSSVASGIIGTPEEDQVTAALFGAPSTSFHTLPDSTTLVLAAVWPIVVDNQVAGAIVVDQNLNGIRNFREQALETLFDTMLLILLLTIGALFIFASSLASRIRTLRNQVEHSIDDRGHLSNTIIASRSNDEIGDLSRSFANIVERLSQYNQYLENMSSRLSHELRTPVTVVRTSLENLRLVSHDAESALYIQRAEEGISRLNLILTNMSEAARLEQILKSSEMEVTELNRVVEACMAEYRQIYPGTKFTCEISKTPVLIMGTAEYIAQLMDKVIANAVEFSHSGKPVRVACYEDGGEAVITVSNSGPYLDFGMKDRIFDSMISLRPEGKKSIPHLGIGLHIARMITDYHGGYIYADNLLEEEGVIVVVRIPLCGK